MENVTLENININTLRDLWERNKQNITDMNNNGMAACALCKAFLKAHYPTAKHPEIFAVTSNSGYIEKLLSKQDVDRNFEMVKATLFVLCAEEKNNERV